MIKVPIVEKFGTKQIMGIAIGHIHMPKDTLQKLSASASKSGKPFRLGYVIQEDKGIIVFTLEAEIPKTTLV